MERSVQEYIEYVLRYLTKRYHSQNIRLEVNTDGHLLLVIFIGDRWTNLHLGKEDGLTAEEFCKSVDKSIVEWQANY